MTHTKTSSYNTSKGFDLDEAIRANNEARERDAAAAVGGLVCMECDHQGHDVTEETKDGTTVVTICASCADDA